MAMLQVRDIDDRLYDSLKQKARLDNRSISQEVVSILAVYLTQPDSFNTNATREFLDLCWEDTRKADTIIKDIKRARRNKKQAGNFHGVFD
jgi:plasmid stability protein